MNLWPVERFFPQFLARLVLIWPKSEDKSVQLVRGSFVLKYVTSYKIHILVLTYYLISTMGTKEVVLRGGPPSVDGG